jgi:hypothetical protein
MLRRREERGSHDEDIETIGTFVPAPHGDATHTSKATATEMPATPGSSEAAQSPHVPIVV